MRLNRLKKGLAAVGAAAIALVGVAGIAATPAYADGTAETTGLEWNRASGNPNWEGTYTIDLGPEHGGVQEVYCAGLWDNVPQSNTGGWYGPIDLLKVNADGSTVGEPVTPAEQAKIANAINTAKGMVGTDKADLYAAAASVVVHQLTNNGRIYGWETYNPWYYKGGTGTVQVSAVKSLVDDFMSYDPGVIPESFANVSLTPDPAHAGETLTFKGQVLGHKVGQTDSVPADGKDVHILVDGTEVGTATTNAAGEFAYRALEMGAADLTVTAVVNYSVDSVKMLVPSQYADEPVSGTPYTSRPQNVIVVDGLERQIDVSRSLSVPTVGTQAVVENGGKIIPETGGTVVDTVSYTNLRAGETYRVEGELMRIDGTGSAVGTGITASSEFTPRDSSEALAGTVELEFVVSADQAKAWAGESLVAYETLYFGDAAIADHKDPEDPKQTVYVAKLGTTASVEGVEGNTIPTAGGTVVDTVAYTNLKPNTDYVVRGELVDKATEEGTGITSEATFTTGSGTDFVSGTVDVTFEVGEGHTGKTFVVFERVYEVVGGEEVLVASHEDINDEAQTTYVPSIGTSAVAEDGGKQVPAEGGTVVDTVTYTNLIPGVEYTLEGELMQVTEDGVTGTGITQTETFTPEEPNGTVDLVFTVPAGHAGDKLVAYEVLYQGETRIADHEDPEDPDQTVYVLNLGTLAAVTGNDDNVISFRGAEVVDTLYYENFEAGVQYNVSGELMWKKHIEGTDGEFEAVPTGITGSTSFTPEGEEGEFVSGTAQVTFTVTEEDAVQYLGETLVVFEYVAINGQDETLASHEDIYDEDQSVYVAAEGPPTPSQELKTDARLQHDGDKVIPDTGGTVVDTVTYEGLRWDREYTVKGELMLVVDGEATGTGIFGETTFSPETDSVGTVEVEFVVTAEMAQKYAGQSLVVFEYLYDIDGELLAQHTDPNSAEQTTYVADLGTTASVVGNDDKTVPSEGGTVIDTVAYTNFKSGTEYTVYGELMVKETGEATGITGSTTFTTPTSDEPVVSGTVDVEFELTAIHAQKYAGKSLVVFEAAFEGDSESPTASHEDLDDEAQTVFVSTERPPAPPHLPKTGSNAAALGFMAMGLIALGGAAVAIRKRLL